MRRLVLLKLADKARHDVGGDDRIGSGQRFFDDGPKRPKGARRLKRRE